MTSLVLQPGFIPCAASDVWHQWRQILCQGQPVGHATSASVSSQTARRSDRKHCCPPSQIFAEAGEDSSNEEGDSDEDGGEEETSDEEGLEPPHRNSTVRAMCTLTGCVSLTGGWRLSCHLHKRCTNMWGCLDRFFPSWGPSCHPVGSRMQDNVIALSKLGQLVRAGKLSGGSPM